MSNLIKKITQSAIEMDNKFHFSKIGMVKLHETLHTFSKSVNEYILWIKIFGKIILLFIIYSFIKFKLLLSLLKSFYALSLIFMQFLPNHRLVPLSRGKS